MRLLLLEDDPLLGEGLRDWLAADGHVVDWCRSLAETQAMAGEPFDALLVDWQLPDGSGLDWLKGRRGRGDLTPVLMLTARDRLTQRIEGLDAGADDYLVKPFDLPELLARLRALGRRAAGRAENTLSLGELVLHVADRELRHRGERVALSPRELALTELLMQRAGRVVPKEQIVARLSSWESDFSENSVEVYVHRLRKRFGELGVVIRTVRGFGYVMEAAESSPS